MSSSEVAVPEQPPQRTPEKKAPVPVPLVGQLNDLDQAYRYAQALAQSSLLPKDLVGKPANVLAIILYGQQLDLTPMQAVQSIYVVNGRPQMAGQLWLSKVREAGHRAFVPCKSCGFASEEHRPDTGHRYEADHDDQHCTFTIRRKDTGEQHTETFTWQQAVTAKLTNKDVWKSYPQRMLLWRAVSNCATVICPEVALGFGAEEPDAGPARPTLSQVAAERADREHAERASQLTPAEVGHGENEAEADPLPEEDPGQPDAEMLAELREIEREHAAPSPDEPIDAVFTEGGES
ncbi:recombinase family protein [Amycolatopsis thermoflava]|uniref:hypothetical protein n=1 Tax=Amycolatopsis thermoflava TaxID=84480 RepID=UPI0038259C7F